jgi:hypothetical protein
MASAEMSFRLLCQGATASAEDVPEKLLSGVLVWFGSCGNHHWAGSFRGEVYRFTYLLPKKIEVVTMADPAAENQLRLASTEPNRRIALQEEITEKERAGSRWEKFKWQGSRPPWPKGEKLVIYHVD